MGVAYVAWDSRIGLVPRDPFYGFWGMSRIAPLAQPRSAGAYEFLGQIAVSRRRWINLFRLRPPQPATATAPSTAPGASSRPSPATAPG
jgi:hypothetical protein